MIHQYLDILPPVLAFFSSYNTKTELNGDGCFKDEYDRLHDVDAVASEESLAALLPMIILAVVQGITEFLPISSSGHLVLAWEVFAQADMPLPSANAAERLALDAAVHLGSLGAAISYFWRDVGQLAGGALRLLTGRMTANGRLFLQIVAASIPLVVAGFLVKDALGVSWRSVEVVAWASIGFGVLLWIADRSTMTINKVEKTTWEQALIIGLAQILALIPGASRSGITMTAARALGFERSDAARFSMLLAIPAILGASALFGYDLYNSGNLALQIDAIVAAALAFVSALIAITIMMAWLRRATFTPFVIYRILLGGLLLYLIYVEGVALSLQ